MQIRARMHVLSPLVPARDVYFLRRCQQIELGMWVIVDVSSSFMTDDACPYNTWRLPSGCVIQDMRNGCSKVKCFDISGVTTIQSTSLLPYYLLLFCVEECSLDKV